MFDMTPKAIIYWVKNYEGFEGVRRINNKRVNLADHDLYEEEKETSDKGIQMDPPKDKLSLRTLAQKGKKSTKTKFEDSKMSPSQSGSNKKSKTRWYRDRVDTKNSINLFAQKNQEMERELSDIKTHNKVLHDENRRLREDMEKQIQQVEALKKSLTSLHSHKKQSSSQSIKLKTAREEIKDEMTTRSKDVKTAQPNLSWNVLSSMFKSRKQQIPVDPQPIRLKSMEPPKRKRAVGKSKDKRDAYVNKRKAIEEFYENNYEEEEEYELIEEEEESEDSRKSGVTYHW